MAEFRSMANLIPNEFGYTPPADQPDLTTIQRLLGIPQVARAVLQNLAAGAASVPVGIYEGYASGNKAGQQAMKEFQAKYGYVPTDPAAQQQLKGLGEFLQKIETDYKIPSVVSPGILPAASIASAATRQASQGVTRGANITADKLVQMITRNPEATAMGVIDETSMPFMQAVAPKAPSLLQPQKSDLGFYSQLEAATLPLQNKGTGEQYLAQISKTPGVKPEELQWAGLEDFLKSRQSVTKAEIQDYLNTNRVDVQEVRLGSGGFTPEPLVTIDNIRVEPEGDVGRWFIESPTGSVLARAESEEEARQFGVRYFNSQIAERNRVGALDADNTKFSQYTLPGGENYREILLTLPQKGVGDVKAAEQTRDALAKKYADLMEEWKALSEGSPVGDPRPAEFYKQVAEARRARDQAVVEARDLRKDAESQTYRSSHFDQPNILAHMRANDRVVGGKKTLFIEEIQSDWHQAGRKKGYVDSQKPWEVFDPVDGKPVARFATAEEAKAYKEQLNKDYDYANFDYAKSEGVPDAPFKTSWHELALKRAIQEASEKGYDQIAFTTGKTQAERYDLSKQVNKIDVEAVEEVPNLYFVDVDFPDSRALNLEVEDGIIRGGQFSGKSLDDVVGKEMAEKIFGVEPGRKQKFAGEDLRIGGEGMKGFYDNILPKSLDKLAKKFDAKVGKTEMDGVEVWQMDITPKMRESVTTKGQPLFAIPAIGTGLLGASMPQEDQY